MDDLKKLMVCLSCQMNVLDCKMSYLTQAIEFNIGAFLDRDGYKKAREWFEKLREATEQSCNNIRTEYKKLFHEVFGDDNGGSEL